ncbi:MAG: hypothetical protein JNN01_18235 [Opitutaceae bacterium]|nr:hypothetical protein [Opitutaceae bacterium]
MSADIAAVVTLLAAVNAVAVIVLVPLSFVGSVAALKGLEKLDLWLRRSGEKATAASVEPKE